MDRISGLPEELLVKILWFVPTKVAVSTSVLSKRWESIWKWVPKLELVDIWPELAVRDFMNKNLPLLRAPAIESFRFHTFSSLCTPEDIHKWLGDVVSSSIRELDLKYYAGEPAVLFPSSLYTSQTLETLKLDGCRILVDVPRTVSLPSLKTLLLGGVTYANEDTLRLLISYCPVLEDLTIELSASGDDNLKAIVVISPSLQRLTDGGSYSTSEYVIVTPSLKYFKVENYAVGFSYLVAHMPKVEDADIVVNEHLEEPFELITSVKRLSLCVLYNCGEEVNLICITMVLSSIIFNNLQHLKLCIRFDYWSKLLFRLLQDSPNLRVLSLHVDVERRFKEYETISWNENESSVPSCLLESLETFEFAEYRGSQEERDFVSFIVKNARRLKSSSITPCTREVTCSSSEGSND
ncbi:unnamed protein product [Thlaspi arvense]|uniref:F-box domain-containing protein n=1 Tax=Thlaspi arvense TaxID=13288 RepID=A0AAU9R409_THLAR|nr:unnamed protein product [Thlaspi arvense]